MDDFSFHNRCIFDNVAFQTSLTDTIGTATEYWFLAGRCKPFRRLMTLYVKWMPPAPLFIMINTNASFDSELGLVSIAGVFRNFKGGLIIRFFHEGLYSKLLRGKLEALRFGLQLAISYCCINLEINVDCCQVVELLNKLSDDSSSLLSSGLCLMCRMNNPHLKHVYSKKNKLADALAILDSSTTIITIIWNLQHPLWIFCWMINI